MSEVTQSSQMPAPAERDPTVRAAGVIFVGDRLLLVRQQRLERSYWLLPGGGVRFGESLAEALSREAHEELGLEVVVGRPRALVEAISPDMESYVKHVVHVILDARPSVEGAMPRLGGDAAVLEARWFARDELRSLTMTPPIADFLDRCYDRMPAKMEYLGRRW
jgi:8-oxo-dGTP diphosphatase